MRCLRVVQQRWLCLVAWLLAFKPSYFMALQLADWLNLVCSTSLFCQP